VRVVPSFLPCSRPGRRDCVALACAVTLIALALLSQPGPALGDENAAVANVLLIEQLTDVATTQQYLHGGYCSKAYPIVAAGPRVIGSATTCLQGSEGDPLARPFTASIANNAAIAVVMNGLVRIALHTFGRTGTRLARYSVDIYPMIMVGNVSQIFHLQGLSSQITFSVRRR
jgi:hypothetical protein